MSAPSACRKEDGGGEGGWCRLGNLSIIPLSGPVILHQLTTYPILQYTHIFRAEKNYRNIPANEDAEAVGENLASLWRQNGQPEDDERGREKMMLTSHWLTRKIKLLRHVLFPTMDPRNKNHHQNRTALKVT